MPNMPEVWDSNRLAGDARESMTDFRERRIAESDQIYASLFVENYRRVEYVLNTTDDLLALCESLPSLLLDGYYDVIRYLPAPPVSEDDMHVIAELTTKGAARSLAQPHNATNIYDYVSRAVDENRFVWLRESRRATQDEKTAALVSTASLMATQRLQTMRRNLAKKTQEDGVKRYLVEELGYREVPRRRIVTAFDAPQPKEFCGETPVAAKKSDIVIGLGDNRFMCVECKVSNSVVNSFKRLNHETVEKTTHWYHAFGTSGVVCAGLLSGVFSVDNLLLAQQEGVSLFWSHDLDSLGTFIKSTF